MNRQFSLRYRLRRWWFAKKYRWEARCVVRLAVWLRGVPVVAVTGTNGKTTTVHLIDRMLREAGYHVGSCTTYGVYHDGVRVAEGDKAGHLGVWRALHCRGLQVIVAEVGRGGMLQYGTGFSQCHVGVVTNVLADHLGLDGVWTVGEMAAAKAEIIRRTDPAGAVVLNADDPRVAAMAQRTAAQPVWFSIEGREREFDRGWFLRDGALWRKDGAGEERLLTAIEMPMTHGGHQRYNIANALAALAAVEAMGNRFAVPRAAQCAVCASTNATIGCTRPVGSSWPASAAIIFSCCTSRTPTLTGWRRRLSDACKPHSAAATLLAQQPRLATAWRSTTARSLRNWPACATACSCGHRWTSTCAVCRPRSCCGGCQWP